MTATGMDTEMGKIAGVLAQTVQEETPLQRKLNELGKTLSKLVLGICIFIFIFDLIVAGEFSLETVLNTFMVAAVSYTHLDVDKRQMEGLLVMPIKLAHSASVRSDTSLRKYIRDAVTTP